MEDRRWRKKDKVFCGRQQPFSQARKRTGALIEYNNHKK